MKKLLSFTAILVFVLLSGRGNAQYVYTIRADSVKITNCDSAELIIENHTQGIPGFLFNTGNGRTQFRRVLTTLNDSTYLVGTDTLKVAAQYWAPNGTAIYNINPGFVGIGRTAPNVLLDLPGPVNIDDTSAYNLNYHPVLKIGGYSPFDNFTNENIYTNLFVGDSTGLSVSFPNYNTYVGNAAGQNDNGGFDTFFGFAAGKDNEGANTAAFGCQSGQNSSPDNAGNSGYNSYFGVTAGEESSGGFNTFSGYEAGGFNTGSFNTAEGYLAASQNRGTYNVITGYLAGQLAQGSYNISIGELAGWENNGNNNVEIGSTAGSGNTGNNNVLIGQNTAGNNNGSQNTIIGSGTASDINYTASRNGITLLGSNISLVTWHQGNIYHASTTPVTDATAIGANAIVKASNTMVFGDSAVNSWLFNSGASASSSAALVVGFNSTNGNGAYLTTGGVWTNASDRDKKENFQSLDQGELLARIDQLPVTRWNYKGLHEQHIGPVAQDFYRLFNVGRDDKTISTIDPSGIALAGIQGLHQKIKDQQAEIDSLKARLEKQQDDMNKVMEKLNAFEAMLKPPPARDQVYAKKSNQ